MRDGDDSFHRRPEEGSVHARGASEALGTGRRCVSERFDNPHRCRIEEPWKVEALENYITCGRQRLPLDSTPGVTCVSAQGTYENSVLREFRPSGGTNSI